MTDPRRSPLARLRRVRWAAVAGAVLLVYVVLWAVALAVLPDRSRFTQLGGLMGSLGGRLALAVVVLAALFHAFDGIRRMLIETWPTLASRDPQWRGLVQFATWALFVPAATVLIWPWISETFR